MGGVRIWKKGWKRESEREGGEGKVKKKETGICGAVHTHKQLLFFILMLPPLLLKDEAKGKRGREGEEGRPRFFLFFFRLYNSAFILSTTM